MFSIDTALLIYLIVVIKTLPKQCSWVLLTSLKLNSLPVLKQHRLKTADA